MTRYQSKVSDAMDKINEKAEGEIAKHTLTPHPETVSETSSTHPLFGEVATEDPDDKDTDMMAGIRNDLVSDTGM